jgi:ubiquinone/menaquinone biosynthesis C-methylase UbiE
MQKETHNHVCPVERAGALDSRLRRYIQNPKKILSPYIIPGKTVIDLGCGPGYFTLEIAKLLNGSGKVIAADMQQGMLDIVYQKIKGREIEKLISLHKCNEFNTGLDVKADFILAFYMVHEVPDMLQLFKELKGLLKPDGKLMIIEPRFHVNRIAFQTMEQKIKDTGFEIAKGPKVFFSRTVIAGIHKN